MGGFATNPKELGRDCGPGARFDGSIGAVLLPSIEPDQALSDSRSISTGKGRQETFSGGGGGGSRATEENTEALKVSALACGAEHLLVLTAAGLVFTCGADSDGQCGVAHDTPSLCNHRSDRMKSTPPLGRGADGDDASATPARATTTPSSAFRKDVETPTLVRALVRQGLICRRVAAGGTSSAVIAVRPLERGGAPRQELWT